MNGQLITNISEVRVEQQFANQDWLDAPSNSSPPVPANQRRAGTSSSPPGQKDTVR